MLEPIECQIERKKLPLIEGWDLRTVISESVMSPEVARIELQGTRLSDGAKHATSSTFSADLILGSSQHLNLSEALRLLLRDFINSAPPERPKPPAELIHMACPICQETKLGYRLITDLSVFAGDGNESKVYEATCVNLHNWFEERKRDAEGRSTVTQHFECPGQQIELVSLATTPLK